MSIKDRAVMLVDALEERASALTNEALTIQQWAKTGDLTEDDLRDTTDYFAGALANVPNSSNYEGWGHHDQNLTNAEAFHQDANLAVLRLRHALYHAEGQLSHARQIRDRYRYEHDQAETT